MRRSPRSLLAWSAAVVVALLTVIVVGSDLRSLHRRANDLGAPQTVAVAAHAVPLGATLNAADLDAVSRYPSMLPADAVTIDDAVGRIVAVPLAKGALVQRAHLAAADRDGLTGVVSDGHRAIRVQTEDGLRPPRGAVVDVLAALDPALSGGGATTGAVVVASAAIVLAADNGDAVMESDVSGVTLLVTEAEALDLAFAAANGLLYLALAPPEAACCSRDSSSPDS